MTIPVEASEIEHFTPASLKEKMGDDAPVFRLRAPSERHLRQWQRMCGYDGLESFSMAQFDAEKRKAIPVLWPDEARAREYADQFDMLAAKRGQGMELTPEELAWSEQLDDQLFANWPRLREMETLANEYMTYAPRHAIAVYCAGWSNLDAPCAIEGGIVTAASVRKARKALMTLGEEHYPGQGSLPFIELYAAAMRRLSLDEDEEKNSPAPSQPSTTPDASTRTPPKEPKASSAESSTDSPDTSSSDPATDTPESA